MKTVLSVIAASVLALSAPRFASAQHDHDTEVDHHEKCDSKSPVGTCVPESTATKQDSREHKEEHDNHKEENHDHAENKEHGEKQEEEHGHEEDHEETSASVGPDKAVLEIKNEGRSLRLSPAAQAKISLKFSQVTFTNGVIRIPKSALLEFQANTAVYKLTADDFVEMLPVTVIRREPSQITIKGNLSASDRIAVSGVPLVRAAQLEASGQGGVGHAH